MGDTYEKNKGNAGLDGVQFQLNLTTVFLLNALRTQKNWKISTENPEAGKFDDLVLDLHDNSVLLQSKFKQNRKISKDQIFSCNSKNADFSLPKYFFSYLEVRSESKEKTVIVCTNTDINERDCGKYLKRRRLHANSMLYYEGATCSFVTFKENILPDLKASAETYLQTNLRNKGLDKAVITDTNIKDFLKHLQFFSNYPSGDKLEQVIDQLLNCLNVSSLYRGVSSQEIYKKVEDWFKQRKPEYLTEIRARALFFEIKSDRYCETLKNYNVSFKHDDLDFTGPKRIFHITASGRNLLQGLKVYHALQRVYKRKLFVEPDDDIEVQKHVIEAFGLSRYTSLIIIGTKITDQSAIIEISGKLRAILEKFEYKKVILVAETDDKLCQQIGLNNICQLDASVKFEDLSLECQKRLVSEKNIIFQGEKTSLEELLVKQSIEDLARAVNSGILEELVRKKEIKVGVQALDLDQRIFQYYVYRTFKRVIQDKRDSNRLQKDTFRRTLIPFNLHGEGGSEKMEDTFSEDNIYDADEDVILIADSAGMGKSTVLTKLAMIIKNNNPHLWVITIELSEYTSILRDLLKNNRKTISAMELLNLKKGAEFIHQLEEFVFSMKKKVVLMVDGVDEISPDYTELILSLLAQCRQATNFAKIIITTRPHMISELEEVLKVQPFLLQPFTEENQVNFLTSYWSYNLDINWNNKAKCEQYAKALIKRMSSWTKGYDEEEEDDFAAIPLQLRIFAEIFQESIKFDESSDWEGCREFLNNTEIVPKLPEKIQIKKLYDMFIQKKRDIYIDKGNPTGNSAANKALSKEFDESLTYHRILALEMILSKGDCELFSYYRQNYKDMDVNILKIGIIQSSNGELQFIHRTFAEYFVAERLFSELQLQLNTPNVKFQLFFIDEVLNDLSYKIIRTFLDSFLQEIVNSIPSNIFEHYQSLTFNSSDMDSRHELLYLLAYEGHVTILQLVLKCVDFRVIKHKEVNIAVLQSKVFNKTENSVLDFIQKIFTKTKNVRLNTLTITQFLVRAGGINIKDKNDWTPLHYAVFCDHLEMVKFLVEQGANINIVNNAEMSPLYLSIIFGHLAIVKYLSGVSNNDNCDQKALSVAINHGYVAVVKYLLESSSDVNIKFEALSDAALTGRLDIVKCILESNNDVNFKDTCWVALHHAAAEGQLDTLEYLVKYGLDANIKNEKGNTALHFAADKGHLAIVEYLVKYGFDANIKDDDGYTALHLAAHKGYLAIVEYLVKYGFDANIKNDDGYTALHFAANMDHLAIVEYFVESGFDVNIKNKYGNTALYLAAGKGYLAVVKYLVESGCDINIENNRGYTALHVAILESHLDVVEYLVKSSNDVYIESKALHMAVDMGQLDIVKNLIKCTSDVDIRNKDGRTALHFAVVKGNLNTVKFLLDLGVDASIEDKDGRTALQLALHLFEFPIASCLEEWNPNES